MKNAFYLAVMFAACLACCGSVNANNNHSHAVSKSASALPSWSLTDANRKEISSDQFAGRPYVLIFHLGQGCLHCAEQLHTFGNRVVDFENAGFEIVGVSTDAADQIAEQLDAFGDSFSLRHFASDSELNLFRGVGALDESAEKPLHATVLVDATGEFAGRRLANIRS